MIPLRKILIAPVLISTLGYFVDIYDLVLFSVVRVQSLKSLGLDDAAVTSVGISLINLQMLGTLVGGILWGWLGDKKGRISMLFGSILLYSLANLLNAFVTDVYQYKILRFIAGVGLAGELGAAVTLVSEILDKEIRGYGVTIIAGFGVLGALVASKVVEIFDWRTAYLIGGVFGLSLLIARFQLRESTLFAKIHDNHKKQIHLKEPFEFFRSWSFLRRYLPCVLIGLPVWYVVGVLLTFSPEILKSAESPVNATGGNAIFYGYLGLALGDLLSGPLSQWLRSRKKGVLVFMLLCALAVAWLFGHPPTSETEFHVICTALGVSIGFWTLFVTVSAEQFGTEVRATVASTVPNFVRGAVIPITFMFKQLTPRYGHSTAALYTGIVVLSISFVSIFLLKETFGKNLDYFESQEF